VKRNVFIGGTLVVIAVSVLGCADENERVADIAMESARWQAEQSQTLIESNQSIADGSKGLVTADAASRQELASLQRELRADQADIARQYEELANDHTQWVEERERSSTTSSSLGAFGLVLACLAPLVLAGWALSGQQEPPTSEEIDAVINHDK
jgi:hypothetical protein